MRNYGVHGTQRIGRCVMEYYGIYKAFVVKIDDSQAEPKKAKIGRVCISVPEVYGEEKDPEKLPWARVLVPSMGGGAYCVERGVIDTMTDGTRVGSGIVGVPPVGATGYVVFEQGDPQWPIWLGTWYGTEKEMPSSVLRDSNQGIAYPYIWALQCPWAEDMFIRFSKDRQIEVSVGGYMAVRLIAETEKDKADNKIQVTCTRGNVEINAAQGALTLSAKSITLAAENNVHIQAGRWKKNELGETVVDTEGDLILQSSKDMNTFAQELFRVGTSKDGEMHASSPIASGFENHGPSKE